MNHLKRQSRSFKKTRRKKEGVFHWLHSSKGFIQLYSWTSFRCVSLAEKMNISHYCYHWNQVDYRFIFLGFLIEFCSFLLKLKETLLMKILIQHTCRDLTNVWWFAIYVGVQRVQRKCEGIAKNSPIDSNKREL